MRRLIAFVSVSVLVSLALAALTGSAQASFPGANGRIAFLATKDGCCNISTMEPDGSDITQLTHEASGTAAFDPSWSPDGTAIVFDVDTFANGRVQLWVMNADGTDQHRLLADRWFVDFSPTYSPDGATIVFTRCRPGFDPCAVYRINADGSGLTPLTPLRTSVQDFAPKYSPDGGTIAFNSSGRGGVSNAVYLMNADGSNVRRLTVAGLNATSPDWSPDGSQIVFSTHCCALRDTAEIWAINIDKTGLHQITFPGNAHDFSPSYAPAGDQIVFERDSADFSRFGVWVVNANGTGATKILGSPNGEPTWGAAA